MKWIAFFSQTGSEIYNLSKTLDKKPDIIITNKIPDSSLDIVKYLGESIQIISKKPTLDEYIDLFINNKIRYTDIITLHGFLRIIPKKICDNYNIINLHPGLITIYPDLKGIDPQKKAFKLRYRKIGAVIHKVSSIVDDGEIISSMQTDRQKTLEETFGTLKKISQYLWIEFLKTEINEKKK